MRPLVLLASVLVLAAACSSTSGSRELSFAQMQAINPGVTAAWLLSEYPFARDVQRRPDGTVAQMGYVVVDPRDRSQSLTLYFDERGVLTRKAYAGPFVRPPVETDRQGNPVR